MGLDDYLARFRDQKLVLIIAPVREAEPMTFACGICGFVYAKYGECPQYRRQIEDEAGRLAGSGDILDQVRKMLDEDE